MIREKWKIGENWRRLLAELIVVAVGVMVALAVDNWNETRKEHIIEREYLAGIVADLETSADSLEKTRAAAIQNQAALWQLIAVSQGGSPPAPEDFLLSLVRATYLGLPRVSRVTFDELVSTGSLRLLRDRAFKRRLAEWYERFDYQAQWYPSYRRMEAATEVALRGVTPIEIRLEGADGVTRLAEEFDEAVVVAALRANADMVPILEDSVWTQHRVIMGADALLEDIAGLRAMLDSMTTK